MKKKKRINSDVSLEQLRHMGYRLSSRQERDAFEKEEGCISSCREVEMFFRCKKFD